MRVIEDILLSERDGKGKSKGNGYTHVLKEASVTKALTPIVSFY
jgi:hypothetical protein